MAREVAGVPPEDQVRLELGGGHTVVASKTVLAARCAFFVPLADEAGSSTWGEKELGPVIANLAPGAQLALPALLEHLGTPSGNADPDWEPLFVGAGLIHAFAAAHLFGAAAVLHAARDTAARSGGERLCAAVAALDARADAGSLRTAVNYGLDAQSQLKLLHAAAAADSPDAVAVLVAEEDAIADADLRDESGRTALHVAAVHDSAVAAAALLEASATIDALCDPPGEEEVEDEQQNGDQPRPRVGIRTALHLAAAHDSADVVQLLLDRRADVASCVRGVSGAVTPLHEAAAADAARAARPLAAAAAVAAAELPAPWGAAELEERPGPQEGDTVVRWSRFMDPLNAKVGTQGASPLHVAAEADAPGVVAVLLEAKADLHLADDQGDTALHIAVLYGAPRAASELLQGGADALRENYSGQLPIHYMAEFGAGDVVPADTPEMRRHFARSFRTQELLLAALRERGQLGTAVAHAAAGDLGNAPLHTVACWDHLGALHAARLLAAARADLEQRNAEGRTPLGVALRRSGGGPVAAALRELGAQEPGLPGGAGGEVTPAAAAAQTAKATGDAVNAGLELPVLVPEAAGEGCRALPASARRSPLDVG